MVLALFQSTKEKPVGKVVFLHGSSGAGKTTLCNRLIKQDSSWKFVEEDDIYYKEAARYWENIFPVEFAAIKQTVDFENILHAILRNQLLFKSIANSEQRLKAKNDINTIQKILNNPNIMQENNNMINWATDLRDKIVQIIIHHAQTHNVIVDTWFLTFEQIQKIAENHRVMHVIAYSSFPEIIKRTIERNHVALMQGKDISNLRFFSQVLKSFVAHYDLSNISQGSIAILDKEAVVHALDIVELQLHNIIPVSHVCTYGEFSLEEFQEYRRNLLSKFTTDIAYVIPKKKYDIIINTDHHELAELVKRIIDC